MSSVDGTVALNNYLQNKGQLASLTWQEETSGPRHAPMWKSHCKIGDEVVATGEGPKRTSARDAAATRALAILVARESQSASTADADATKPESADQAGVSDSA
ncbi:hypothetical protein OH77DRAFT_1516128 [Trametes cingulata]|nr:hypothetical protein OH77DRAFT_1516128 [Trametes cingulata]